MQKLKFAAVAAFMAAFAGPALAQTGGPQMPPIEGTLLSVSAEGLSESAPDMGTISLGVIAEGATAQAALAANSQRMNALMQALRRAGLADRDIQTSNVSVNPQYTYEEGHAPRLTGYQANNQVSARVRDLANLGRVIDSAVAAGGNTVNGISFSHQDPDVQLDAARRDAATAARRRADLYAQAFGMRVHRVVAISEGGGYSPPIPLMLTASRMSEAAPPPPIAPGEIETRVSLNVTYELR